MTTAESSVKSVVISSGATHKFKVRATYSISTTETKVTFTVTKVEIAVDKDYKPNMDGSMVLDGTTTSFDWKQIKSDGSSTWTYGTIWSGSKSKSWNRTTTGSTKTFKASAYPTVQGTDYTATVTVSIPVNALKTYTITYKSNYSGGAADQTQTKTHGTAVTLKSASTFSRTGYTFSKWNTASGGGGTNYSAGASYSTNANLTLYAQWTVKTFTISYNANGGSGAPSSQTKTYGVNLNLSTTKPTRAGYTFHNWNTLANGSGTAYASGATYTGNSALSLFAIWKPVITATLTLSNRCSDSACTVEDENGAYVKASVMWSCPVSVTSSSLSVKSDSGLTIGTYTFSAGTTGSYEAVISGFDSEKSYPITASFSTGTGSGYVAGSVSVAKVSSGTVYMLDFKGKTNVGILGPAHDDPTVGLRVATNKIALMSPGEDGVDTFYIADNARTGVRINIGVGSGGINHGLYSSPLNKWMIYADTSTVYVNGTNMATTSTNSSTAIATVNSTNATLTGGWAKKWGRVVTVNITWTNKAAVSVPANGNITDFVIFTLNEGYRPAWVHVGHSQGDNAGAAWYYIATSGAVQLCACEGTGTARSIAAGTTFNFVTTFLTP